MNNNALSQNDVSAIETLKAGLNEGVFIAFDITSDSTFHYNCEHFWRGRLLQVFSVDQERYIFQLVKAF